MVIRWPLRSGLGGMNFFTAISPLYVRQFLRRMQLGALLALGMPDPEIALTKNALPTQLALKERSA